MTKLHGQDVHVKAGVTHLLERRFQFQVDREFLLFIGHDRSNHCANKICSLGYQQQGNQPNISTNASSLSLVRPSTGATLIALQGEQGEVQFAAQHQVLHLPPAKTLGVVN